MSESFTRGVESAANTARRATPSPVGGPVADLSALQVRLGEARKALWQRNLRAAERDVDRVLAGLSSGNHLTGAAARELRTFEASAYSVRGQILAEEGGLSMVARAALDRAVKVFRLVIGEDPGNAQAYADYGAALHLLGMHEEAYLLLSTAARLGDKSPYTARLLAGIMLDRGNAKEAKALLKSANTAVPGDARILSLLGRVYLALGDSVAAQSHLNQAATAARQSGDLPLAAELFGQVVASAPDDADLWCALGDVLRLLGSHDEALAAFDNALRLDPGHQRARIGKADALRVRGDFEHALLLLDEVLAGPEMLADALAIKGDVLRLLGRYEEAAEVLDLAVERDQESAWIIATRGQVRRRLGRLSDAERDLAQAVLIDRVLVWAWAELAATRHLLGDGTAAMTAAARAIELDADVPLALAVMARQQIASGKDGDAIGTLERLRTLAAELSWVWTDLAEAYRRRQDNRLALDRADLAIQRGVAEPVLRLLRAELVVESAGSTQADRVRDDLAAYLASEPDDPAGLRRAGQVYRDIGDRDRAAEVFGRSLQGDDDPDVRRQKAAAEYENGRFDHVVETLAALPAKEAFSADLLRKADAARELGDLKLADHSYKLALDADRSSVAAMNGLVVVNLELGKVGRAWKYASMAVKAAPDDAATLACTAEVELATHKHEQALVHLARALERARDNPDVLLTYAFALCDTGSFAEAVDVLDHRARTSGIKSPAGLLGFAIENLAVGALPAAGATMTDETRTRLERAYEVYLDGLEEGGSSPFLLRGLADTTYVLRGRAAAEPEYVAVVAAMEKPGSYDGEMLGVLGWCYCRLGRFDEATRTYVSALSADHGSADTLYVEFDLALATLASGRPDLGEAEYERAWALRSRFSDLQWRGFLQVARNDLVETLLGGGFTDRAAPERIAKRFDEMLEELW